jgi:hypothetical protein
MSAVIQLFRPAPGKLVLAVLLFLLLPVPYPYRSQNTGGIGFDEEDGLSPHIKPYKGYLSPHMRPDYYAPTHQWVLYGSQKALVSSVGWINSFLTRTDRKDHFSLSEHLIRATALVPISYLLACLIMSAAKLLKRNREKERGDRPA